MDGEPLLRTAARFDVAAELPRPAVALALGDPPPPWDAVAGPQLRLRAVRGQGRGRRDRWPRPLLLALRLERRRAGEPRGHAPLHRALHAPWLQSQRHGAGLRPRRVLSGRGLHADGAGTGPRYRGPRDLSEDGGGRAARRGAGGAAVRLLWLPGA